MGKKKALKKKIIILILLLFFAGLIYIIRPMVIMSGSMEPSLKTGSLCFLNTKASFNNIKEGDIVTYTLMETNITHRVSKVTNAGLITKGDANDVEDLGVVDSNNYCGKVLFSIPLLGYLAVFLKNYFWVIIPIILITVFLPLKRGEKNE